MTEDKQPGANEQPQVPVNELIRVRLEKVDNLREKGIEPYAYRYDRTHDISDTVDNFDRYAESETVLSLAGRIMLKRKMGKSIFADLHDATGRIQIYLKIDNVGKDEFKIFDKLDLGDIVGIKGTLFTTKTGEKTVMVTEYTVLSKAVQPLPDKYSGLVNKDLRYRHRYADLIMNPRVRRTFAKRSRIIKSIRDFLDSKGFLEVETPILQPLYGGAAARPFKTHHNTLDVDLYLRIADELYLKRLIVGGFDKVWEYCKDFRNEGMDRLHNPEFSMVELYWAYADYRDIMSLYQEMMRKVVFDLHGKYKIKFSGHELETEEEFDEARKAGLIGGNLTFEGVEIDFEPDFKEVSMVEAVKEKTGIDLLSMDFEQARAEAKKFNKAEAKKHQIDTAPLKNWGKVVEAFFEETVEADLIQPTIIKDFPREISPLAKVHRDNPRLAERFEVFIGGQEVANAFSELNDPVDQLKRFKEQVEAGRGGDEEAHQLDEDYVLALMYGMPPTGGLGFGIDRLVMLLTNNYQIQDVILFPQMRPEGDVHKTSPVEILDKIVSKKPDK